MARKRNSARHVSSWEWIERWQHELHALNEVERPDFLKRLLACSNEPKYATPVYMFLEIAAHDPAIDMKSILQTIASEHEILSSMSSKMVCHLGMTYVDLLEKEVAKRTGIVGIDNALCVDPDETKVMASYLGHMSYSQEIQDKVDLQSLVITMLGHTMQYDQGVNENSWEDLSFEQRQDYLTRLSLTSDYVLTQSVYQESADTIYTDTKRPAANPVVLHRSAGKEDELNGLYNPADDTVHVMNRDDYASVVKTLQHEKAHQMIMMEYRHAKPGYKFYENIGDIQYVQYAAVVLCNKNASKDCRNLIYFTKPEERLARIVTTYVPMEDISLEDRQLHLDFMQLLCADPQGDFQHMQSAVDKMAADIRTQSNAQSKGPKPL